MKERAHDFSNIHRIYKSFIISAGLTLATLFEETYYLLSKKNTTTCYDHLWQNTAYRPICTFIPNSLHKNLISCLFIINYLILRGYLKGLDKFLSGAITIFPQRKNKIPEDKMVS